MNISHAKHNLKLQFESGSKAILVSGDWGIGKSYLIKEFLEEMKLEDDEFKFITVSAFNSPTLAEFKKNAGLEYAARFGSKFDTVALSKTAFKVLDSIPVVSNYVKNIETNVSELSYQLLKDTVVWIDDFERCPDEKTSQLILGEAFMLTEYKNCRIIIAANTEDIEKFVQLKSSLEKVCTSQFNFKRDYSEILEIGLCEYSHETILRNIITEIGCKNIRILSRIKRNIGILMKITEDLDPDIKKQIITTATLATIAKYGSIKELSDIQALYSLGENGKQDSKTSVILYSVGYTNTDSLDRIIIDYIDNGSIDSDELKLQALDNEKQVFKSRARNNYNEMVHALMADFSVTSESIFDRINNFITSSKEFLSVFDYDNVVKVIKNLQQTNILPRVLEKIPAQIEVKKSNTYQIPGSTRAFEEEISSRIIWIESSEDAESIETVLSRISSQNGWNHGDEEILLSSSIDDMSDYFLKKAGANGMRYINTMLQFGEFAGETKENHLKIGMKAVNLLENIAIKNPDAKSLCDHYSERTEKIKQRYFTLFPTVSGNNL